MPIREEQFQEWYLGPQAKEISERNYGNDPGSTQRLLEDLLRGAFEGGYDRCLTEVRRKLKGMGTGAPKTERAAPTKPATSTRRGKVL